MDIHIRRATIGDVNNIIETHYSALEKTNDFYASFLKTNPKQLLLKSMTQSLQDSEEINLVAETTEHGIIGFVQYAIEDGSPQPEQVQKQHEEESKEKAVLAEQGPPVTSAAKDELIPVWDRFLKGQDVVNSAYTESTRGQKHICKTCRQRHRSKVQIVNINPYYRFKPFDGTPRSSTARSWKQTATECFIRSQQTKLRHLFNLIC